MPLYLVVQPPQLVVQVCPTSRLSPVLSLKNSNGLSDATPSPSLTQKTAGLVGLWLGLLWTYTSTSQIGWPPPIWDIRQNTEDRTPRLP